MVRYSATPLLLKNGRNSQPTGDDREEKRGARSYATEEIMVQREHKAVTVSDLYRLPRRARG